MTRVRTALVGMGISLAVVFLLAASLVAFDLHLHKKFDQLSGLNYRGYRGAVLGRKTPGEIRIGLFGGSVASGYGTKNEFSMAALLERALNDRARPGTHYKVANLAMNGETGIVYFKANYELFRYLGLDVLVFYVCQEDLRGRPEIPEWTYSERSLIPSMRAFGYYFIFPTVVREKYYLLRYGSVERGYREGAAHTTWFDRAVDTRRQQPPATASLRSFLGDMARRNTPVVLAFCPDRAETRKTYHEQIERSAAGIPQIVVADLGGVFPPGEHSSYLLVDDMHYSEKGNRAIGEALSHYIPR